MSLLYLRHGQTKLNKDSGERLRGWLPVDLDEKGQAQAKQAAEQLKGVQPATFHTSDLQRAIQTAQPVEQAIGMKAIPTFSLRDWNTGDLAGQKFEDVKDVLHSLIDNADQPAPNGESFNSYAGRFVPFVKSLVESPETHLVVGHARGSQILHSLANRNGQDFDRLPLKEKPALGPGQMLMISPDWSTLPNLK
jgi:broad specificity phosphatase PhoE